MLILGFVVGYALPLSARASIFGGLQDSYKGDVQENFQKGVVSCAATAGILFVVGFIAGNLNVPTSDPPNTIKDTILDCVLWAFKNAVIQMITGETVQWVQNGMGGNPAFVTNIRDYLRHAADKLAGAYIEQTVPFLCSPFRDQIQRQLILLYKQSRGDDYLDRISCSFTEASGNLDRFFDGDFAAGGWDMWFEAFSKPTNNPYGAYIQTSQDLAEQIAAMKEEQQKKIDLGQGFLSKEVQDCYVVSESGERSQFSVGSGEDVSTAREDAGLAAGTVECDSPRIVTPGTTIKNSLEQSFGVQLDQIAAADEFDEIVALWAVYLVRDVLEGDEGLSGYNKDDFTYPVPDVTIPDLPGGGSDSSPGDSEPAGPAGPSVCFDKQGTFLVPQQGSTVSSGYTLTPPQNTSYDRLELEVDITNNGWPADREGWPVEVFWMGRPANKDLFGYSKVNAPNSNVFMLRHGVGQSFGFKPKVTGKLPWSDGATYHFKYVYDATNNKITLTAYNKGNGNSVASLSSVPDVAGINVGNKKFNVGFGYSETEANPKERPMYGWEYSNMKASFITDGDAVGECTTPSPWGGAQDNPATDGGSGGDSTGTPSDGNSY